MNVTRANGPWDYHPAIHGQEGVEFVIYPEGTSEPLADVLIRDGAEAIARLMTAAPKLLEELKSTTFLLTSACPLIADDEARRHAMRAVRSARAVIDRAEGKTQ